MVGKFYERLCYPLNNSRLIRQIEVLHEWSFSMKLVKRGLGNTGILRATVEPKKNNRNLILKGHECKIVFIT